jgi:hypothetical protein
MGWYVIGRDNRRYKNLYLLIEGPNNFRIGTRAKNEFNATYSRCCLSKRRGMAVRDARLLRLSTRMLKRKLAYGTLRIHGIHYSEKYPKRNDYPCLMGCGNYRLNSGGSFARVRNGAAPAGT